MEDEKLFIQAYLDSDKSIEFLAKEYNIGRDRATRLLKDNNIPIGKERSKIILQKKLILAFEDYKITKSITQSSKKFKISPKKLREFVQSKGMEVINYQNISSTYEDMFDIIDTEEKAYWLGFLYADGCITKRNKNDTSYRVELGLKESDYNHLVKFKTFLNCGNKISFHKNKLGNSYRLTVGGKKLANSLIEKGCVPRKSLVLTFPSEEIIPKELMIHFIRGYIEGDGYIGLREIKSNKLKYRCGVVGTLEFILGMLNFFGYDFREKQHSTTGKAHQYEFSTTQAQEVVYRIYKDCNIYLDRKYELYIKGKESGE